MGDQDGVYFWNRHPNRTYLSKSFTDFDDGVSARKLRFANKVIDSDEGAICEVEAGELIIRRTDGGRQQIKALFFEDDRSLKRLVLQKFNGGGTKPSKDFHFSFSGEEIERLLWILEVTKRTELDDSESIRFSDDYLEELLGDDDDLLQFVQRYRDRIGQLDSVGEFVLYLEFCERKRQVELFENLLRNQEQFDYKKSEWHCHGDEAVWQRFFERNPWIFGLGLSPVYLSGLDGKRLEQVVRGYSVAGEGKRADGLLRTNGILSSLCFVEIKTHHTSLLAKTDYRPGAWSVSSEVSGGVSQCHTTVQAAMTELQTRLSLKDHEGNPTGDELFLYQPRLYLVVGCLDEFMSQHGPNESKFRSFELYRRYMRTPEIVTFDELLERARATVQGAQT